jgi:UDP-GlcNAc:undecaprenyl-phosphate GlcNAc-1-phosphate transferase
MNQLIFYFSVFLLLGLLISWITNGLLLKYSRTLGIRNKNDVVVRWANESKPSLGGISLFAAFFFGVIVFSILFNQENNFQNKQFVGLLSAASLAFIMGLSDDAYNTKPMLKLFVQIACGLILYYTGTIIFISGNVYFDCFFTVLWVVGMMNSLNMLDNMDGITGTSSLFILLSCFFTSVLLTGFDLSIWSLTLLVQIGALIGFLRFNVNPSKLFMGDAGSQFIGLFVAFFAIHDLWNIGLHTRLNPLTGGVIVLIAFTPAIADTLTVVINRLRKGKSPMVGGKDHTTHHLVYRGLSDRQVWYVFSLIGLLATVVTLCAVYFVKQGNPWIPFALSSYFFLVFLILFRNTLVHKK